MAQTNSIQIFNNAQFGQIRIAGTSDTPYSVLQTFAKPWIYAKGM